MDSTESSYVSSPEAPAKRSPPPPKSPSSDNMEKGTYIRFLVSNSAAGSVIGKGGSTINDFQSESGARIQLSRNHEFFPGTTDRIIMVSGTINEILKAIDLVLAKLLSELHAEEGDDVEPRTKVRLIVPHSSCGAIIGKGGSTIKKFFRQLYIYRGNWVEGILPYLDPIMLVLVTTFIERRSFIEDSQAGIKISPQDHNYMGSSGRLVTLSGTIEEQLRATDLIVSKLSEDSHYTQSMNYPFSYPTSYVAMNYVPNGGAGGRFPNNKEDRSNSLTIGVSDGHIGLVVGRGGRNIMEISQASGARIKISERGDFMSGTSDRKVTITGSQRSIRTAESMIMQKVAYASERVLAQ